MLLLNFIPRFQMWMLYFYDSCFHILFVEPWPNKSPEPTARFQFYGHIGRSPFVRFSSVMAHSMRHFFILSFVCSWMTVSCSIICCSFFFMFIYLQRFLALQAFRRAERAEVSRELFRSLCLGTFGVLRPSLFLQPVLRSCMVYQFQFSYLLIAMPNKSLEPTGIGAVSNSQELLVCIVVGCRWLSFFR